MIVVDPLFELRPKVFDRVQIGTIWGPINHWYALICEPIHDFVGFMDRRVILHEPHPWLPRSRDLVVEYGEI